jgi:hypothetical protein
MCFLRNTNWVFISQKTTFFIVTAVKTSDLARQTSFRVEGVPEEIGTFRTEVRIVTA